MTGSLVTRLLTPEEGVQSQRLWQEGFGVPPDGEAGPPTPRSPGSHTWGTFDGADLLAVAEGHEYTSWYGGVAVPTTGVAAVTVVPERRGSGLLGDALRAVLVDGRERGEVLSTLFPTAPGVYRRFGYEVVAELLEVELTTASLLTVQDPGGVTLRRATATDVDAIRAVHATWAAAQNGPLTRRGPLFGRYAERLLARYTGVTLAEDEQGRVVGYLSWRRGQGYDEASSISVDDLLAVDGRALPALWRFLGGFAAVAPTVRLRTSGADPARLCLPFARWPPTRRDLYMLRVGDVAGALRARPAVRDAELVLAVTDPRAGLDDGCWAVSAAAGAISVEPVATRVDVPTFDRRGFALLYAGAQTCATLRLAGLLTGPDVHDRALDSLLDQRPLHVRDYF